MLFMRLFFIFLPSAMFQVCPSLSFLDEYVYHALSADARPYRQHMKNFEEEPPEQTGKFFMVCCAASSY